MIARFYNFSKKYRSSKLPPSTGYAEVSVSWKESTSIHTPTLLLNVDIRGYNYCYIPDFGTYYFRTDCRSVNKQWEVDLEEDSLATYRTDIGATSANILYADGSDKSIVDSRIPILSTVSRGHNYVAMPGMTITPNNGVPASIIGITGKGSFGPYLMQDSNKVSDLLDGIDTSLWTDPIDFFKQAAYGTSAADCIRSAIGIPLVFGASEVSSGTAEALYLGNYPCLDSGSNPIYGYKITKKLLSYTGSINIPWRSSDWKRISAYTSIIIYVPFIGLMNIPATEAQNDSALSIHLCINVTSGDISCEVHGADSGVFIANSSGNCALPLAYGSTGIDTGRLTTSILGGMGAVIGGTASIIASGGASTPAVLAIGGGLLTAAGGTISAMGGNASGSAGLGGGATYGMDKVMHCFVTQKNLSDTQANFNPIMGKPYMGVATIGSFSGYVQTDGFQLEAGDQWSKNRVNRLMDGGIYYE